ncbi:MAG: signal recognition particle protein [Candidatus Aenigmarchaeota archaeon]|nr:signal recognition particle protein [Candidatus Aenigmarchaeota archaeon]
MVLEKLGSALKETLRKITRKGFVDKELLEEMSRDIQRALLQSDVNVKLVFDLTQRIKKRSLSEKPPTGLTQKEHVINIIYEELVKFLGGKRSEIPLKPIRILLVGLFGSGKTTTVGKLALFYKKRGLKTCMIACDTFRPAAYEQLIQIGKQIGVPVFGNPEEKDSSKVLREALKKAEKYDVKIVDSSGRDALNDEMIEEIKKLNEILNPEERILVVPADLGQQAENQAKRFQEALNITGIIITKMDGTAKGGGALTSCAATGAPVKFIGTGEKLDALEKFDPERFISRLIGFGDLKTLLEKAKEAGVDETAKKIVSGKYTLEEFYEQIEKVQKMGPLSQVANMIPGFSKIKALGKVPDMSVQEEKLKHFKFIIDSMTPEEKQEPSIIDGSRVRRIAKGSGCSESEVRELLKLYKQSKKVMKMIKPGKGGMRFLKQFGIK